MTPASFIRDTIDLVRNIETRFLELAARLYIIQDKDLWEGRYETYNDFLAEAKITPGNASMLAKIHKAYVIEGKQPLERLAKAGYSNLYTAIPLIERDGVETTVEKARLLTRAELKEEVREEKHGDCLHHEIIKICASCHQRMA